MTDYTIRSGRDPVQVRMFLAGAEDPEAPGSAMNRFLEVSEQTRLEHFGTNIREKLIGCSAIALAGADLLALAVKS